MRGRDQSHVDLDGLQPTDALERSLLQHPQQLGLGLQADVADLVEKQRTAVGQLETSDLVAIGAGEGAFYVAEQLALQQARTERGAVNRDEWLCRAQTVEMNRLRE